MSQTLLIALMAIVVVYLLITAKSQRKKYRDVKKRIKDRSRYRRD